MCIRYILGGTLLLTCTALSAQTLTAPGLTVSKENRTISVSASDHAEAEPEVADIHVGFKVYGITLPGAYKAASEKSNGIVAALLAAGAQQSQIQSQSQQVARLDEYEMKSQRGMKFSVQQEWTVSVAPKDVALVLDGAIQAGANQSGEIEWRLTNSIPLTGEAIRRASDRAQSYAAEMAKSMGAVLGKPLYATNTVSWGMRGPEQMMNARKSSAKFSEEEIAPLAIRSQRVQSTATVQIIYAIE